MLAQNQNHSSSSLEPNVCGKDDEARKSLYLSENQNGVQLRPEGVWQVDGADEGVDFFLRGKGYEGLACCRNMSRNFFFKKESSSPCSEFFLYPGTQVLWKTMRGRRSLQSCDVETNS